MTGTAIHRIAWDQGPIAGARGGWSSGTRGRLIMNMCRGVLAWLVFAMAILPLPAAGQDASKALKPEELEQIVAPIALHPDALLVQVLMASTYPLEVVEAARFVKANPTLQGDQLNQTLQQYAWDDSVKSLVMFPQALAMMNEKLDWMQKLGDAFLSQQQDLLAAIQRLRARAQASGQLKSTPEQNIVVEPAAAAPPPTTVQVVQTPPSVIRIEPTNPEVVYVPSYDPNVVYGAWPPAYPPYYPYPPGYFAAGAFTFAAGAAVGAALWGEADWHHGDVNYNASQVNNFTNRVNNPDVARGHVEHYSGGAGAGQGGRGNWQHNPEHRKGVQYRDTATQQRFNRTGPAHAEARQAFRGRTASQQPFGPSAGQQPAIGQGARPGIGQGPSAGQQPSASVGQRPGLGQGDRPGIGQQGPGPGQEPAFGQRGDRGGLGQQGGFQGGRQAGAFEGIGGGRDAQSFSDRGRASRQSFSRSSAAGGGARAGGGGARSGGGGGGRAGGGGRGGRR
jgi:hypothetical protein